MQNECKYQLKYKFYILKLIKSTKKKLKTDHFNVELYTREIDQLYFKQRISTNEKNYEQNKR